MSNGIKFWKVLPENSLKEITKAKINLESRIEGWLEEDISVISSDLLVIGRQVRTSFGAIDILCIDRYGDIVIVELKRDRTLKDVIIQILNYGFWVKDLSNERVAEIAKRHLGGSGPLEEVFRGRFGTDLPEVLNDGHELLIVAPEIDSSSRRIIEYLSSYYGARINAVTFNYFRDQDSNEFLARVFLIEPSKVESRSQMRTSSKKKRRSSYEELQELAERKGVGELYRQLLEGLTDCFDERSNEITSVAFLGIIGESRPTIFSLMPGESDTKLGVRFYVYIDRLSEYLGASKKAITEILPSKLEKYEHRRDLPPRSAGYFKDANKVRRFLSDLHRLHG